ncbi:MAG: CDP-alcohol phosphatidyltransferase family protein [Thermoanaerobaculia bacterium]
MNEWRERLARWFSPLARHCPLSPNAITLVALAINLVAATFLANGSREPWLFLASVALITVGGLADAFDGIVARVQGKTSRFGDFLDHCADRLSDTFLGAGWLMGNDVRQPLLVAAIVLIMMNGYIGTQIEATYRHRSYEAVGRGEFVLALVALPILSYILYSNGWQSFTAGTLTVAEWFAVLMITVAVLGIGQRVRKAWSLEQS